MGLFPIVGALGEAIPTIVRWGVAHEAVLQGFVALLVPLEVADHLLFLREDLVRALQAVEVLSGEGGR